MRFLRLVIGYPVFTWIVALIISLTVSIIIDWFVGRGIVKTLIPMTFLSIAVLFGGGKSISGLDFSRFRMDIVVAGVFFSAFLTGLYDQYLGFWPSVFWTDIIAICIISNIYLYSGFRKRFSWQFCIFIISISGIVDVSLRFLDPYQTISLATIVRLFILAVLFLSTRPKISDNFSISLGHLAGMMLGYSSYVGMVTGRTRIVGDSFPIPDTMLSIIFAFTVVIWPWLIVRIIEERKVVLNQGS